MAMNWWQRMVSQNMLMYLFVRLDFPLLSSIIIEFNVDNVLRFIRIEQC